MKFLIPALQKLFSYLVAKLLLALGVSFVTYTGYSVGLNMLKQNIAGSFSNMPSDIFNLLMMAGFGQAVGMIFGAFAFNIAMSTVSKFTLSKTVK